MSSAGHLHEVCVVPVADYNPAPPDLEGNPHHDVAVLETSLVEFLKHAGFTIQVI